MPKIKYRIIAVPERREYVDRLLSRTGIHSEDVFWDYKKKGCMWNAIRAWNEPLEDGYTHLCILADDTDVCDDFIKIANVCVSNFQDVIWTFYSNELNIKHKGADTPYIVLDGYNIRGIANLMPVRYIKDYTALCDKMLSEYGYQRDDATCRIFALMNDIPVMTTIPNLVRSYEIPSSMKGHGVTKNSNAWCGYNIDSRQFFTQKVKHVLLLKKSVLETHLHSDNPVDIQVRQKWKKVQALRKV